MKKEDIIKAVDKPGMISGIFNYCDRWCERCDFTKRCANFTINDELFSDAGDLDLRNKRFWEKMHEVMQVTLEMVMEKAEEMGIDLDAIDMEAFKKEQQERDEQAEKLEISTMGKAYIALVDTWFDSSKTVFDEKAKEFELMDDIGLPRSETEKKVGNLTELVEVIRWYQFQIYVKILRAVTGKMEDFDIADDGYPKDSDGSAKVALIGIDRSVAAWGEMLSVFPDQEDRLYKILIHLEGLRRKTEMEFPDARNFIRPGFDER